MSQFLFVYGTLRNHETNEMAVYLKSNAQFIGNGSVKGTLIDLGDYPGFTNQDNNIGIVTGDIFKIENSDIFSVLDEYEQSWPLYGTDAEYKRVEMNIQFMGKFLTCWIYVYNRPM